MGGVVLSVSLAFPPAPCDACNSETRWPAVSASASNVTGNSLLLVATALAAVATATCGPIAFVAFVAGPIGRQLTRQPLALPSAALLGAVLLVISYVAARRTFAPIRMAGGSRHRQTRRALPDVVTTQDQPHSDGLRDNDFGFGLAPTACWRSFRGRA